MLSTAADLRLAVAGQTPKVALEVAHAAIQFCEHPAGRGRGCGLALQPVAPRRCWPLLLTRPHVIAQHPRPPNDRRPTLPASPTAATPSQPPLADNRQQALYAEYAAQQAQRKIARTQDQCRKKLKVGRAAGVGRHRIWPCARGEWVLPFVSSTRQALPSCHAQEVHNGYLAAKRKYQVGAGCRPCQTSLPRRCRLQGSSLSHPWWARGSPPWWVLPPFNRTRARCRRHPGRPELQEVLAQKHSLQEDNKVGCCSSLPT